jgi:hypothetical protein
MTHPTPRLAAIIGSGLAGMIAGYAFPGVPIYESSPAPPTPHRAVLRFRSDVVSRLTGIPFRRVRVRKGIWFQGQFREPNIRLANLYSRKCLDRVAGDRSIWDIDAVDRWVAPETLAEQMTEHLASRIQLGCAIDFGELGARCRGTRPGYASCVLSTAPLASSLAALELSPTLMPSLVRAPIWVRRYRLPVADAHQTVYFPDQGISTYRASLTGSLLTVEMRDDAQDSSMEEDLGVVAHAFGIARDSLEPIDSEGAAHQRYGKIVPLEAAERRGLLAALTLRAGIYSLGRFATWRNVLLDDVVADTEVIRGMLLAGAANRDYAALRASAER